VSLPPVTDLGGAGDPGAVAASVVGVAPSSLLAPFVHAGVLVAADVHVARTLARLAGEHDEVAILGAAFAVRAVRMGHVCVDLDDIGQRAVAGEELDVDLDALPWPDPGRWRAALAGSPLVTADRVDGARRPLVLDGSALYLERMWRDEHVVATEVAARAAVADGPFDPAAVDRLFARAARGGTAPEQRRAGHTVAGRRLAVIAGGPGTGKTTTVAWALAALFEGAERRGSRPPLVALAAPTGKAAARLAEAVAAATAELGLDPTVRARLQALEAFTVHRLLGPRPGVATRFHHHAANRLPHDIVVVDETSMLPLWLMARLVTAMRSDAHLVLVGDPEQLVSVEAGAVLADIVGPSVAGPAPHVDSDASGPTTSSTSATTTGPRATGGADTETAGTGTTARVRTEGTASAGAVAAHQASPASQMADCVVRLVANHRFSGALAELAAAVADGDAARAVTVLRRGGPTLHWLEANVADPAADAAVAELCMRHARHLVDVARGGDADTALGAIGAFRLLCAHRHGPAGAVTWNDRVARRLAADPHLSAGSSFFVGRPVIVTANDYALRLFNGDVGVVIPRTDGTVTVAFRRGREIVSVPPASLPAHASVYAMTVHKSQGSEFDEVAIVLPEPSSRILTRELLYTALTRARERVVVVGSEAALRAGIERRVARASGLMARLWGASAAS